LWSWQFHLELYSQSPLCMFSSLPHPISSYPQCPLSAMPLFHLIEFVRDISCTYCSSFHIINSLLHANFPKNTSFLPVIAHSPTSLIIVSFSSESEYSLGNLSLSKTLPIQISSQSLIFFPSSNSQAILLTNQLCWSIESPILLRSRHYL